MKLATQIVILVCSVLSGLASLQATQRVREDMHPVVIRKNFFQKTSSTNSLGKGSSSEISPIQDIYKKPEKPGIRIKQPSNEITEFGNRSILQVSLKTQPISNVTLQFETSDPGEAIVIPESVTFTPDNWDQVQDVSVMGQDDELVDGDQPLTVRVTTTSVKDFNYIRLKPLTLDFVNRDDDQSGIKISDVYGKTSEDGKTTTFEVYLTSRPKADVSIFFKSDKKSEGVVLDKKLIFTQENWDVPRYVTVQGKDEFYDDDIQMFNIVVSKVVSDDKNYDNMKLRKIPVWNEDNDQIGIIAVPQQGQVSEDQQSFSFRAKLNSKPTGEVLLFAFSTDEEEGVPHKDHIIFTPDNWRREQSLIIHGVDDKIADGAQKFQIKLVTKSLHDKKYNELKPVFVDMVNYDNDSAGFKVGVVEGQLTEAGGKVKIPFKLATVPTQDVHINFKSCDPDEGVVLGHDLTFSPENWDQWQNIIVAGMDDGIDDESQPVRICFSPVKSKDSYYNTLKPENVVLDNQDDDQVGAKVTPINTQTVENGTTAQFTVRLQSKPTAEVTLRVESADTTEGVVDVKRILFNQDNWDKEQSVIVTGQNDDDNDGDQVYDIILHPMVSKDEKYNGMDLDDIPITNKDNNSTGFTLAERTGKTSEKGDTVTIPVKLNSKPAVPIKIEIISLDKTEGIVKTPEIIFTENNWNNEQMVVVAGVDDFVKDGDARFSISLRILENDDPNFTGLMTDQVELINEDDDQAGIIVKRQGNLTRENGDRVKLLIRLKSEPTSSMILPLSTSDPTEARVVPNFVLLDNSNWNEEQVVEVIGEDDDLIDGNQNYQVQTSGASTKDPVYREMKFKPIPLLNVDLDRSGFIISQISGDTTERGGKASFDISLQTIPKSEVRVRIDSSNPEEGVLSTQEIIFTTKNATEKQTISAIGVDDGVNDYNKSYKILFSPSFSKDSDYNNMPIEPIELQNIDFIRWSAGIHTAGVIAQGGIQDWFAPGYSVGLIVSYSWSNTIELSSILSQTTLEGDAVGGDRGINTNLDVSALTADIRYHLLLSPFKLYLKGGSGFYSWKITTFRPSTNRYTEDMESNIGFLFGGGAEFLVFSSFLASFDVMDHMIIGKFKNNSLLTGVLNLQYSF